MHDDYDVLSPTCYRGLWVYPITRSEQAPDFMPLPDALEERTASISEAPHAFVPVLELLMRAPQRFVALSGTLLRGGRQNRAVRCTQIWEGPGRGEVEVRCVEARRWGESTGAFHAESVAPPTVRAALSLGSQGDVWSEVTTTLHFTGVHSRTESLLDHADLRRTSGASREPVPPFPGANTVGYVALDGERPVAAELVCNDRIARCYWNLWMGGLAVVGRDKAGDRLEHGEQRIKDLVGSLSSSVRSGHSDVRTEMLEGEATFHGETLVHLVAWPRNTTPTNRLRRRRTEPLERMTVSLASRGRVAPRFVDESDAPTVVGRSVTIDDELLRRARAVVREWRRSVASGDRPTDAEIELERAARRRWPDLRRQERLDRAESDLEREITELLAKVGRFGDARHHRAAARRVTPDHGIDPKSRGSGSGSQPNGRR